MTQPKFFYVIQFNADGTETYTGLRFEDYAGAVRYVTNSGKSNLYATSSAKARAPKFAA